MSANTNLYKILFPSKQDIMTIPQTDYVINSIIFKSVLLYGHQGAGKTELVRALTEEAIKRYGKENVNAKWVMKGAYLPALMDLALDNKLIQILFTDNATLSKIPDSIMEEYFAIRHKWYERTKRPYGYILSFVAAHRFHGVNLSLRTDNDVIIAINAPSNPYDRSVIKKYMGEYGIQNLDTWEKNGIKGNAVCWSRTNIETIQLPLATTNYLDEIPIQKCEYYITSPYYRYLRK